ncbi:MAG TPA: hypothetical protein EYG03_09715 [Planctomycetes bacterium]|nr:hypothetical protein [Planctomycetota bacterium]
MRSSTSAVHHEQGIMPMPKQQIHPSVEDLTAFSVGQLSPHQKLVLWIVRNYPESAAAGSHEAQFHAHIDPDGYVRAKNLWLQHAKTQDQNVTILRNAAKFFLLSDRDAAEGLLKRAQIVDPNNADVAQELGHLYRLGLIRRGSKKERQKLAEKSMEQFEIALEQDATANNYYLLAKLSTVAFEAGAIEKAKQICQSSAENE